MATVTFKEASLDHFNSNDSNLQHSFGILNMAITHRGLFVNYVIKKHVVLVQLHHLLWKNWPQANYMAND